MSIRRPTAEIADPDIKSGSKPYHKTAKDIMPILVKIAKGNQFPITYTELAEKIGLPKGRFTSLSLRYPLGSIERAIKDFNELGNHNVPQLTSLVVREGTKSPGKGISPFFDGKQLDDSVIEDALVKVYAFSEWNEIAEAIADVKI